MTDMDRFTEQNDLKTTKLQKLWRSPEQRYRYLEDFFVLLMEMIGWCGIYMAVLLYTKRTATEDILGMLTVFVWIYVCFAKNGTLGAKKCGHQNKRSKVSGIYRCYYPYNGTLVRNYLPLWIAWQIGADGKRYHCPLYVDRFMEYGCFDQMVADTQRAFQLYREMVFGGRSCIYIFVGNILRESTFSTFGSDFGSRPVDAPYVVWLFGAA